VPQPGVMARWRPDLQGKQRPESLEQFKRDGYVYVTTSYFNKVQGFKVNLYDNPDPRSGYRPGLTPVDRIYGTTTVFLGIPYALPPVKDGRFRVRFFSFFAFPRYSFSEILTVFPEKKKKSLSYNFF